MKPATKTRPCILCSHDGLAFRPKEYGVCAEHQCEALLLRKLIDDANKRRAARV